MKTRCKMVVIEKKENVDTNSYVLNAVTGESEENKSFFKWTPSASLNLQCTNKDVVLEVGQEYYVDLTPAQ